MPNVSQAQLEKMLKNSDVVIDESASVVASPTAVQLKKMKGSAKKQAALLAFVDALKAEDIPEPEREVQFVPDRRWRFDLAWPERRIAFECEGGTWMQTATGRSKGHAHPKRFAEDCIKYSAAAIYGWMVIRATPDQMRSGDAMELLRMAFDARDGYTTLHQLAQPAEGIANVNMRQRWLTAREVAQHMGVSAGTVYQWMKNWRFADFIRIERVGGKKRINRADLLKSDFYKVRMKADG